jgi:hypothetical protein
MRMAAVVAAAGIALAGVVAAPPSVRAADGGAGVTYLFVSPQAGTAAGLVGGQEVGIGADVSDPGGTIGADPNVDWLYTGVMATVTRTAGGPRASVAFDLKPTTYGPGRFYGSRRVASTWAGTWTVTDLTWYVGGERWISVDPRVDPGVTRTFTVVGTQVPTISSVRIPRVAAYGARQWVQYTVRTSAGAPAVGLPVVLDEDIFCGGYPHVPPASAAPVLRTDAAGRATVRLYTGYGVHCVDIWSRPIWTTSPETAALLATFSPTRYEYYKSVSAVRTATSVRVNRTVTVVGSATPARGTVRLQRLVGRTWRTIASAPIRTSGRYTVSGLVTTLGRNYFRVLALNGLPTLAPTPSRLVLVTGTRR